MEATFHCMIPAIGFNSMNSLFHSNFRSFHLLNLIQFFFSDQIVLKNILLKKVTVFKNVFQMNSICDQQQRQITDYHSIQMIIVAIHHFHCLAPCCQLHLIIKLIILLWSGSFHPFDFAFKKSRWWSSIVICLEVNAQSNPYDWHCH